MQPMPKVGDRLSVFNFSSEPGPDGTVTEVRGTWVRLRKPLTSEQAQYWINVSMYPAFRILPPEDQ